jgi:hypothetical protein
LVSDPFPSLPHTKKRKIKLSFAGFKVGEKMPIIKKAFWGSILMPITLQS